MHCMDIELFVTGTKMRQFNKPKLPKSRPKIEFFQNSFAENLLSQHIEFICLSGTHCADI
jgi:5'-3' exonuclease